MRTRTGMVFRAYACAATVVEAAVEAERRPRRFLGIEYPSGVKQWRVNTPYVVCIPMNPTSEPEDIIAVVQVDPASGLTPVVRPLEQANE